MAFYSQEQLLALGFRRLGSGVRLSDRASIYNAANIELGDGCRVDDFCVLSAGDGGIAIGRHVHVAVYCSLMGVGRIELQDFSGMSSRVAVYSSNDHYSGEFMTNPAVPAAYTRVATAPVVIGRHVIIGAGSIVLPGVTLHEGSGVGALSLVKRDCDAFGMYAGVPAVRVGSRGKGMLERERAFREAGRG
jgi:dTDP-4-amino-4,6-dideoxy-D-glucose acyltransferase